jgi:hypothetical protein
MQVGDLPLTDGNLYAATGNGLSVNGEIHKFAPDGTESSTPFVGGAAFPYINPVGLAFDPSDTSGYLFVSTVNVDGTQGEIRKFAPNGTEITPPFAPGLTNNPFGIAFDNAHNLFVAEVGVASTATSGDILEFTPGGTQTVFASQNFGTRGNHGPKWLAFTTGALAPPTSAVALVFPDATEPLTTTVTYIDQNSVPPPPSNFELSGGSIKLVYDITTTTAPTPPIIIAFTVPSSLDISQLKALHYECDTQNPPNCNWVDSTIQPTDPNYPLTPRPTRFMPA